jgi:hypothetical protein
VREQGDRAGAQKAEKQRGDGAGAQPGRHALPGTDVGQRQLLAAAAGPPGRHQPGRDGRAQRQRQRKRSHHAVHAGQPTNRDMRAPSSALLITVAGLAGAPGHPAQARPAVAARNASEDTILPGIPASLATSGHLPKARLAVRIPRRTRRYPAHGAAGCPVILVGTGRQGRHAADRDGGRVRNRLPGCDLGDHWPRGTMEFLESQLAADVGSPAARWTAPARSCARGDQPPADGGWVSPLWARDAAPVGRCRVRGTRLRLVPRAR